MFSLVNFSPDEVERRKGTWQSTSRFYASPGSAVQGCC